MPFSSAVPVRQASTSVIAALSLLSMAWYAIFIFAPGRAGHPVAYGLLVLAEVIGMVQMLGVWLTLIMGRDAPVPVQVSRIREALPHAQEMPISIAVLLPVAGEPIGLIRSTATAARDLLLPHRTVLLDDARSDDMYALAAELGIEYMRRSDNAGWKAGNLNHALEILQPDYFAVFDSDHRAEPEFLLETLPWLLADEGLAFVQTPQEYSNDDTFISGGASEAQSVFYRHIQPAKNAFGAAFYIGTNALFRGDAIRDLGGFHDTTHSEDIWTAYKLHQRGWRSHYLAVTLARGLAPETVDKYFRQQYRWATGGFEIFLTQNPLFRSTLTLDQRLQYLHSSLFFFCGISAAILFILPLLYVYFGWKAINVPEGGVYWAWHFFPYYAMTFLSAAHLIGRPLRWRTIVTAMTAFPSHIAALFTVITGIRVRWSVTGVIRRSRDYVTEIAPHLLLLLLSLGAVPILIFQSRPDAGAVGMNTFWLLWNSAVLLSICKRAFPEARPALASAPAPAYSLAS
jgi:cellulose synthase (UDP-forming)